MAFFWVYFLILSRALAGPLVLVLAYRHPQPHAWILFFTFYAIISDIYDGIIARKFSISSDKIRLHDCYADIVYWVCASWCVWVLFPQVVVAHKTLIILMLILEWVPDIIYLLRFKKDGCSHSYLSKLRGLLLLNAFVFLFGFQLSGWAVTLAIWVTLISQVERVLIAVLLPSRLCDIPTAYHAWLARKGRTWKANKLFHQQHEE